MLLSLAHFLQTFIQKLLAGRVPERKLVDLQEVHLREKEVQPSAAPVKKSLKETDAIPTVRLGVKGPDTEPQRALVRHKRPAQRYRKLDAMLEEMKKDRLTETETIMVPAQAHTLARQLHHSLEPEPDKCFQRLKAFPDRKKQVIGQEMLFSSCKKLRKLIS